MGVAISIDRMWLRASAILSVTEAAVWCTGAAAAPAQPHGCGCRRRRASRAVRVPRRVREGQKLTFYIPKIRQIRGRGALKHDPAAGPSHGPSTAGPRRRGRIVNPVCYAKNCAAARAHTASPDTASRIARQRWITPRSPGCLCQVPFGRAPFPSHTFLA